MMILNMTTAGGTGGGGGGVTIATGYGMTYSVYSETRVDVMLSNVPSDAEYALMLYIGTVSRTPALVAVVFSLSDLTVSAALSATYSSRQVVTANVTGVVVGRMYGYTIDTSSSSGAFVNGTVNSPDWLVYYFSAS